MEKATMAILMASLMLVTIFSAMSVNAAVGSYTNVKLTNDGPDGHLEETEGTSYGPEFLLPPSDPEPTALAKSCAIIVCGGYAESIHKDATDHAVRVFGEQYNWDVKYLIRPNENEVEDAIVNWVPLHSNALGQVVLFFVDHGSKSYFCLTCT